MNFWLIRHSLSKPTIGKFFVTYFHIVPVYYMIYGSWTGTTRRPIIFYDHRDGSLGICAQRLEIKYHILLLDVFIFIFIFFKDIALKSVLKCEEKFTSLLTSIEIDCGFCKSLLKVIQYIYVSTFRLGAKIWNDGM